jgi:hypothetical protein
MIYYLFKNLFFPWSKTVQANSGPGSSRIRKLWTPRSGSVKDYESPDPEPKEIFTDPMVKSVTPD